MVQDDLSFIAECILIKAFNKITISTIDFQSLKHDQWFQ